jgi:hypothetical protein
MKPVGVGAAVQGDQAVEARIGELLGDLQVPAHVGPAGELLPDLISGDARDRGLEVHRVGQLGHDLPAGQRETGLLKHRPEFLRAEGLGGELVADLHGSFSSYVAGVLRRAGRLATRRRHGQTGHIADRAQTLIGR